MAYEINGYGEAKDSRVLRIGRAERPHCSSEKVAVERVGSMVYDIWDVHCADERWWAVTNPLNAYLQTDFKSRDVVLTFHIGLAIRVANQHTVPIREEAAEMLPGSWRRWEQAVEALSTAAEAEDFQAVGMRLRECLVSFVGEVADDHLVPEGEEQPQAVELSEEELAARLATPCTPSFDISTFITPD